jgi:hypothetical protein
MTRSDLEAPETLHTPTAAAPHARPPTSPLLHPSDHPHSVLSPRARRAAAPPAAAARVPWQAADARAGVKS